MVFCAQNERGRQHNSSVDVGLAKRERERDPEVVSDIDFPHCKLGNLVLDTIVAFRLTHDPWLRGLSGPKAGCL